MLLTAVAAVSCSSNQPEIVTEPQPASVQPKQWSPDDNNARVLPPAAPPEPMHVAAAATAPGDTSYGIVTTRPSANEFAIATPTTQPRHRNVIVPLPSTQDTPEKPGPDNTGVADQKNLKVSQKIHATDGQTIENLYITGGVVARDAHNVTIRNCLIDAAGGDYGVVCTHGDNIIIEHCEIYGMKEAGIWGDSFTARWNNIYQSGGDGFKPEMDCVVEHNWVHDLGWNNPKAHSDGVQIRGGSNDRIEWNFFDLPINVPNTKSNTTIFIQGIKGKRPAANVIFAHNWCVGGNFSIHGWTDGGDPTSIKITGNRFSRGSTRFGMGNIEPGVEWKDNVFDETDTVCQPADK